MCQIQPDYSHGKEMILSLFCNGYKVSEECTIVWIWFECAHQRFMYWSSVLSVAI